MKRLCTILLLLSVAASLFAPPQSISLRARAWSLLGNGLTVLHDIKGGEGWCFDFPVPGDVDYIRTDSGGPITASGIQFVFNLTGTGTLVASETGESPNVRALIQKTPNIGEFGRWWSNPICVPCTNGTWVLSVPIAPEQWTSVFGVRGSDALEEWQAALANADKVGFTFGGSFFGHGAYVTNGTMRFTLVDAQLIP